MNLFYCPDIHSHEALLSPEESYHCVRVLRLVKGDRVQVIDGRGGVFEAVITMPDAKRCHLGITRSVTIPPSRNFNLHIAIAPTKSMDRFEWFMEKAVEIGIDTITPLLCQRSERRVTKTARLQKLIISTMKQAMVTYRPVLNELTDYQEFLESIRGGGTNRFIAHCEGQDRKRIQDVFATGTDVVILIGPEGDFSPEEVHLATGHGFTPITLGQNRLRTETAGVVTCSVMNLMM